MGSYVPNTLEERKKMLQEIGYSSIEDLFAHIPEEVKIKRGTEYSEWKSQSLKCGVRWSRSQRRTRCSRRSSAEPELTDILSRQW